MIPQNSKKSQEKNFDYAVIKVNVYRNTKEVQKVWTQPKALSGLIIRNQVTVKDAESKEPCV